MAHVLVIEDEPTIAAALRMALQYAGHQPQMADNGLEGLRLLRTGPRPDLVITDLYMPAMNGSTLLGEIRSDPHLQEVPVILMTGAVPEDLPPPGTYQGLVTKPFKVTDVLAKVKEILPS